ncbi:single-stranded DNA-binding protein [Corynebacterium epidermidicanis]|uniref:Single-stranded DNA-binding protein n=1 Tax=Corynebacterium epidermidicanis TaxID=1050174 RepID=A0A0G3GWB2_9CORY|nr:single-stranded DNA-binding protein [Corynebacterium epidermidicanis]AKK03813.1 single-stranded DNA-binding protein [Corynebacterium epidermidicanis]
MPQYPITLTGNIVSEPIKRRVSEDAEVVRFRLACSSARQDGNGNWQNYNQLFIEVEAWNNLGMNTFMSAAKGSSVIVSGFLMSSEWMQDGQRQFKTYVKATHIGLDLNKYMVVATEFGPQRRKQMLEELDAKFKAQLVTVTTAAEGAASEPVNESAAAAPATDLPEEEPPFDDPEHQDCLGEDSPEMAQHSA